MGGGMVRVASSMGGCLRAVLMAFAVSLPGTVWAFEVPADEKDRLLACEKDLCEIILKKEPGADLKCELSKTWAKETLTDGAEARSLSWSMGDARCSVTLEVKRQMLLNALTADAFELKVPQHAVLCELDGDAGVTVATMTLAPTLKFEKGQAVGVDLGVGNIDAPKLVEGAIWTVAKLESTFGLFEGEIVEQINKFIEKKCPKKYGTPE